MAAPVSVVSAAPNDLPAWAWSVHSKRWSNSSLPAARAQRLRWEVVLHGLHCGAPRAIADHAKLARHPHSCCWECVSVVPQPVLAVEKLWVCQNCTPLDTPARDCGLRQRRRSSAPRRAPRRSCGREAHWRCLSGACRDRQPGDSFWKHRREGYRGHTPHTAADDPVHLLQAQLRNPHHKATQL